MSVMTQRLEFLLTDYIPWLSDLYIPLHTVSLDLAFIVLSLGLEAVLAHTLTCRSHFSSEQGRSAACFFQSSLDYSLCAGD